MFSVVPLAILFIGNFHKSRITIWVLSSDIFFNSVIRGQEPNIKDFFPFFFF